MQPHANARPALPAVLVWATTLMAAAAAWGAPKAPAPSPAPSASAKSSKPASPSASAKPTAAPTATVTATATPSTALVAPPAPSYSTGLSPLASGAVPKAMVPPGADSPDAGPSRAIFPTQRIPLRFNHRKHVKESSWPLTC